MCGILFVSSKNEIDKRKFEKGLNKLIHRGPDNLNYNRFNNSKVFVGHTRLKIIDLDDRSNQPFHCENERYFIVFNGEIYNYKQLTKELNLTCKTSSDTEVLLKTFLNYGKNFLQYVDGIYAGIIFDKKENKFFVFRDLHGVKPLLYYKDNDQIIFASELKAIKEIKNLKKNNDRLNNFKITKNKKNYIHKPFFDKINFFPKNTISIFNEIEEVESSKIINLNIKNFLPGKNIYQKKNPDIKKIKEILKDQLISDTPVAFNFSGGVDSFAALSLIDKRNLYVQTAITDFSTKEDLDFLNIVEDLFKIEINRVNVDNHNFDQFSLRDIILHTEHPIKFANLQDYFLSQNLLKNKIKVVTDGEGGDEIFFGYKSFIELIKLRELNIFKNKFDLKNLKYLINYFYNRDFLKLLNNHLNYKLTNNLRFKDIFYMMNSIESRPLYLSQKLWKYIYSNFNVRDLFGNLQGNFVSKYILKKHLLDIKNKNTEKIINKVIFSEKNSYIQPLRYKKLKEVINNEIDIYFQEIKINTNKLLFDDKFNLYQYYLFKNI